MGAGVSRAGGGVTVFVAFLVPHKKTLFIMM